MANTPLKPTTTTIQLRSYSLLGNLSPAKNSQANQKRLGRGPGSGHGKTSGRGQKGQKARGSVPNWFEGGQTPIYKLFPKRGFYRHQKLELNEIPLTKIQRFHNEGRLNLKPGETLTMAKMKEIGLITGTMKDGVVLLGNGAYDYYKLNIPIEATRATSPAIEIIEKNNGKFTAKYYSRYLGFKAHHSPEWFIRKRGYLPLQSKPIARRDVKYYSDPSKRGYLVGSEYISKIQVGGSSSSSNHTKQSKKSELELELQKIQSKEKTDKNFGISAFNDDSIVSFKDLKL
ncbi:hypothetical protein CANARDRAFT_30148 [[Candida] arabinofermentans NRRL YB-2248]|uniref:Large ribosomal subunit protein uL15/eL18 domain-containing protein n=1 Tax=[Candida] arabinofermentans NRRL YB-2248 TaxID=983967 RepID=A0A1E4SUL2_9ASCO|nr:hypothetical protein CANARDRAFT_30148 [[Candida] arabinofermentans NRRL YB-2248]